MSTDASPNLTLPYIAAAQAQKHVTHNEAIRLLDALVQAAVLDRTLAAPPATPADGARYIVAAAATGAWIGQSGNLAAFQDGAWRFLRPQAGWLVWAAAESKLLAWNGSAWVTTGGDTANFAALLGINTAADTTNRLALKSDAALFDNAGAGHQLKVNKAGAANSASLLFQTGYSGRAEIGATGDDNFHIKVSANGTTWNEAILIDRTTGAVTFPRSSYAAAQSFGPSGAAHAAGLVPDPGAAAGAARYLREDGAWSAAIAQPAVSRLLRAPAASDDSTLGYAVGAPWLRQDTGEQWTCLRNAAGAAVWQKINISQGFLVDAVPNAAAAYGVTRLRRLHPGNCFQIKRASDSTTLDIGFVRDVADWASADAFLTGTTGVFSIWYDQSGNGLNAVAGANPPGLSFNTVNGLRAVTFASTVGAPNSFTLPAGLSLARNSYSAVLACYPTGAAGASQAFVTNGSDATYSNNSIFYCAGTSTHKVGVIANSILAYAVLEHVPQALILTSAAAAVSITQNETTTAGTALSANTLVGGAIGYYSGYQFVGEFMAAVFYARPLSAAETLAAKAWAYWTFRIAPQVQDRLVLIGDSICAGSQADPALPWSRQMQDIGLVRPYRLFNMGVNGQLASWYDANFAANTAPTALAGVRNMLLIAAGTNDINAGATAAAVYASIASLVTKARAAGFSHIGVATVLPRANNSIGGAAAFEAIRGPLNTSILGNAAGADFTFDPGGDAAIGTTTGNADTALYASALHPTAKGDAFYAARAAAAVNARG